MKSVSATVIAPTTNAAEPRPFWSVMIQKYYPDGGYLRQALESVLQKAPGPEQMQIAVVDDCFPGMDVAALVKSTADEGIAFPKTTKHAGLVVCWNTCIDLVRGEWVLIRSASLPRVCSVWLGC